jgi:outer membrane protein OmpA-like peptidoglycan-associated protein
MKIMINSFQTAKMPRSPKNTDISGKKPGILGSISAPCMAHLRRLGGSNRSFQYPEKVLSILTGGFSHMKRLTVFVLIAAFAAAATGCATDEYGNRLPMSDAEKGAIIGAVSGAAVGAIANKSNRNRGAIIGAIGGGIAGAAVGNYMDAQKKDFEKVLAPEVKAGEIVIQKVGEHDLLITMTSQTAFDFDSSVIKPGFYTTMDKIANILVRYGKTQLTITGHTDNIGSAQYNQALSERRAKAVNDYLINKGVLIQRLAYFGRGASQPRASNATEEGRRLNRRVEILVQPVIAETQNPSG